MNREEEFTRLMKDLVEHQVKQKWWPDEEPSEEHLTLKLKKIILFGILDTFATNIPKSMETFTLGECKEYYQRGRARKLE